jgi:hypothetical protein
MKLGYKGPKSSSCGGGLEQDIESSKFSPSSLSWPQEERNSSGGD